MSISTAHYLNINTPKRKTLSKRHMTFVAITKFVTNLYVKENKIPLSNLSIHDLKYEYWDKMQTEQ